MPISHTEARAKMPPNDPKSAGLFSNGAISAIMAMHEPNIPAAPTPLNARPNMRTFMFGATPQTKDPTSKRVTAAMKTHLVGAMERTPPKNRMNPAWWFAIDGNEG